MDPQTARKSRSSLMKVTDSSSNACSPSRPLAEPRIRLTKWIKSPTGRTSRASCGQGRVGYCARGQRRGN